MSNDLIFGKSNLSHVVSTEVLDDEFICFIEKDGIVSEEVFPNEQWVLSSKKLSSDFEELEGSLHFKYGKIYTNSGEFEAKKKNWYKYDSYFLSDPREANLIISGITYHKNLKPSDVSILSFDIETCGLVHNEDSKVLLIANTFRRNGVTTRKMFCYDEFDNEGQMIEAWCKWVREVNPAILISHNGLNFDFPYIQYVADKYNVKVALGRDGSELKYSKKPGKFRVDGSREQEYNHIRCWGREIIDSMYLALRYDAVKKKYENYGLKQIIKQEGLEDPNRVFYDASKIKDNYKIPSEWEKIKAYAQFDGDDCIKLYDLMIPAYFYFNQSIPKTFQQMILSATGSQLNSLLVRSYLQHGHSIPKADEGEKFQGAISFGNKGRYKNVFRCDVASLYPSIMLQYEIFDKVKDPKGNFLAMVRYFTDERFKNKKLAKETGNSYYTDLEQAQKIGINSAYGLLGAPGLNFNKIKLASLVTEKGREVLQRAIEWSCGFKLEYIPDAKKGEDKWRIPASSLQQTLTA